MTDLNRLRAGLDSAEEGLLTCVHCGFCLPACPTYRELGDEADSPRGRLHLMRAVAEGRLAPESDAFQTHIDQCLGCRACEPVCPSGVPYGSLLETARAVARSAEGASSRSNHRITSLVLSIFGSPVLLRPLLLGGRLLRATGIPRLLAQILPRGGLPGNARFGMAMLGASAPGMRRVRGEAPRGGTEDGAAHPETAVHSIMPRERVALLPGCVQSGLYARVVEASGFTLEVNGFAVTTLPPGRCCGALHAHAGDPDGAHRLARERIAAFERSGADWMVTDAAGCGAALKEYGHWFQDDAEWGERAARFSAQVRDVTELLASRGPRSGGPIRTAVAYDPPCHLRHAQRADGATEQVLAAIPGLDVRQVADPDACCGGAGIYGVTHPELGGAIGARKIDEVRATGACAVATGNPGCMMQIGAGLVLAGSEMSAVHPVELLAESYRRGGLGGSSGTGGAVPGGAASRGAPGGAPEEKANR